MTQRFEHSHSNERLAEAAHLLYMGEHRLAHGILASEMAFGVHSESCISMFIACARALHDHEGITLGQRMLQELYASFSDSASTTSSTTTQHSLPLTFSPHIP